MSLRTAFLAGATGLTGGHCLKILLEDSLYSEIRVLTRKPLPLKHPKLREQIIDFDNLEQHGGFIAADHVFCCLGTTIKQAGSREAFRKVDLEYPVQIAQLARGNGATHYLLISALGANPDSRIFYNRVKGETEEKIKSITYPGVMIFRPSLLLGDREEFRTGEKVGEFLFRLVKPFLAGRLKKYRPVAAHKVARSMVELAKVELKGIHIFESDDIQFFHHRLENPRF